MRSRDGQGDSALAEGSREHTWPVRHDATSELLLIIDDVDYEVRLFWRGDELLAIGRDDTPSRPFRLEANRRYTLRYNNNDGGPGRLRCRVVQRSPDEPREREVFAIDLGSITGPRVVELPFVLVPE